MWIAIIIMLLLAISAFIFTYEYIQHVKAAANIDFEQKNLQKLNITQKKLGESCLKNSECDLYLWCKNGFCANKSTAGGSCTSDQECNINLYCDTTTQKCIDSIKYGYVCNTDNQCLYPMKCLTNANNTQKTCGYLYY